MTYKKCLDMSSNLVILARDYAHVGNVAVKPTDIQGVIREVYRRRGTQIATLYMGTICGRTQVFGSWGGNLGATDAESMAVLPFTFQGKEDRSVKEKKKLTLKKETIRNLEDMGNAETYLVKGGFHEKLETPGTGLGRSEFASYITTPGGGFGDSRMKESLIGGGDSVRISRIGGFACAWT